MLGLFGTLNLGARSLDVQQQASEVAGHNLANASNPAYARQRLVIQTAIPLSTPIGEEGTGANAVAIQQVRDSLLDNQITAEASVTGSLNAQQSALDNAQSGLGEQLTNATSAGGATNSGTSTASISGLAQSLSNLFNSFQSLSTDPSSLSQRQAVIGSAQELATQFNQTSSQLTTVRNNLNQSIQTDVNGANQDLADITSLNKQIVAAEASGGTPNDLIDLRQQKLEDLAGKVNITTTADANGAVDVNIGGLGMVVGVTNPDTLATYDAGGGRLLVQALNGSTPITLTGGSVQGEIDARDGALATLQTNVDTLAGQLVSQVNSIYSAGYDLNGNTGQSFLTGNSASTIGVNSAVVNAPSTFQAAGSPGAPGDNSVALALAQLANTNQASLGNTTFTQNYAQTVAALGASLSSVNDQVTNSQAVSQMLTNQRSSNSGVSIDEEMTNLMQFQRAYEASAELITTVNDMLTAVLAMKTS
jgi:flagellar hook-associated protein 1 FlgK